MFSKYLCNVFIIIIIISFYPCSSVADAASIVSITLEIEDNEVVYLDDSEKVEAINELKELFEKDPILSHWSFSSSFSGEGLLLVFHIPKGGKITKSARLGLKLERWLNGSKELIFPATTYHLLWGANEWSTAGNLEDQALIERIKEVFLLHFAPKNNRYSSLLMWFREEVDIGIATLEKAESKEIPSIVTSIPENHPKKTLRSAIFLVTGDSDVGEKNFCAKGTGRYGEGRHPNTNLKIKGLKVTPQIEKYGLKETEITPNYNWNSIQYLDKVKLHHVKPMGFPERCY